MPSFWGDRNDSAHLIRGGFVKTRAKPVSVEDAQWIRKSVQSFFKESKGAALVFWDEYQSKFGLDLAPLDRVLKEEQAKLKERRERNEEINETELWWDRWTVQEVIFKVRKPKGYAGEELPEVCRTWWEATFYAQSQGMRLLTAVEQEYLLRGGAMDVYEWMEKAKVGRDEFVERAPNHIENIYEAPLHEKSRIYQPNDPLIPDLLRGGAKLFCERVYPSELGGSVREMLVPPKFRIAAGPGGSRVNLA